MDYSSANPKEIRNLIRAQKITGQTSGMCAGYAQANLCILPKDLAFDFLLFCTRNPRPCPLLEVGNAGSRQIREMAENADVATDFPKYRIWKNGVLTEEAHDISDLWQDDFVYFLIGCSFSFEAELIEAGIPVRHIEEGRNVPMFNTNIPLKTGIVNKRVGSYDYGDAALTITRDSGDDGQGALKDGFDGSEKGNEHSFEVKLSDGSTQYFTGVISSFTTIINDANSWTQASCNIALTNKVVEVAPSP